MQGLDGATDAMLARLGELVEAESPTADLDALRRAAAVVEAIGTDALGISPERIEVDGRLHLRWSRGGRARVGLLAHYDTVWPLATLAERPFVVSDGRATGPGIFDMKAGIIQGFFAAAALGFPEGVEILVTGDEEIGSPTSRPAIEALGRSVEAVLVLEPSHGGAIKVARKGVSLYRFEITGAASHAGLEPEKGINALTELAHVLLAAAALADPASGTTVTPTLANAGIAKNVVPPRAELNLDVRALAVAEQERVDRGMRAITPTVSGARLQVDGGSDRPPLEARWSAELFQRAQRLAAEHGLGELKGVTVGGGSDGNLTAALGTPTLDGLGAVGGGAHAIDEHILVAEMVPRATLVSLLIQDLLDAP